MNLLINVDVPDLHEAIEFYCSAVGLSFNRIIDGDVAELSGATSMLYLLQKDGATKIAADSTIQRCYSRHWTPVHLDFVVEDLVTATRRALKAGARQESACIEWMGSKCISFSDPFGHGFCLIEIIGGTYSAEADVYHYEQETSVRRDGNSAKYTGCSFCGKFSEEVQQLVAGPGVFICNECVERAAAVCRRREHPQRDENTDT